METRSLTQALQDRRDCPSLAKSSKWIKRGWVKAEGGGEGIPYLIDDEALWQLRVLHLISSYFNAKVLRQVSHIIQTRHTDETYTGWLGVMENGEVVNLPIADVKVGGIHAKAYIDLSKIPFDPDTESPFN